MQAVDNCDSPTLRRCVSRIKGRCERLTEVVKEDVGENPACSNTEQGKQIEMAIQRLTDKCKIIVCMFS